MRELEQSEYHVRRTLNALANNVIIAQYILLLQNDDNQHYETYGFARWSNRKTSRIAGCQLCDNSTSEILSCQ